MTVQPPERAAAGWPAIRVTLQRAGSKMGLVDATRELLKINQVGGFDCPGCAWPEEPPGKRKRAEFCEQGAKAVAEERLDGVITDEFWASHSVDALRSESRWWLGQQGRLARPVIRRSGSRHFTPLEWDEALDSIAVRLRAADPSLAAFYTSGRTSNEAAFLYQLFVRGYGTNNLPDCSNMCHEATSVALGESIGIGKGTVQLDDFAQADLIVIVGQNPGSNHPRMLATLEEAKRSGARIVAVNPLPEAGLLAFKNPQTPRGLLRGGTVLADMHLAIRVGGDQALFRLLAQQCLLPIDTRTDGAGDGDKGVDRSFIAQFTSGFEAWKAQAGLWNSDSLRAQTGLADSELAAFVELWRRSKRIIACWAMGVTQHTNGVDTVHDLVNVMLLGGHIGRPGAGLCPVRGHSNVQGDRTMGIWDKPEEGFLDRLGNHFAFDPPRQPGFDVTAALGALIRHEMDVFVGLGGNFVDAVPDTEIAEAALDQVGLNVQIATKLNRTHLFGEETIVLPVLSRMERDMQPGGLQFVTVEDSMSKVHASTGTAPPHSPQLRSEVAVIADLAARTLAGRDNAPSIDWDACRLDNAIVRAHIAAVVAGFDDFEDRVREQGFTLDNPARRRVFNTASGFALFVATEDRPIRVRPADELLLQTLRSHDQYNTTIYGFEDRYRGISGDRRVVLLNQVDIIRLSLSAGMMVDLESTVGGQPRWMRGVTVVEYPTPEGCAAAYYPEANVLIPVSHHDPKSGTPASKSVPIRILR